MLSIANSSLTYLANTDLSNDIQVNYSSSTNLLTFNDSGKAIASAGLAASAGNNNFDFSTLTILSPEVATLVPIEEYAGSQVLTLDYSSNVLDQITDYLSLQSPASIGVVRIIGHGSDGALFLGDQIINQQTLGQHSSQILDWKRAFTADADILLYGCSVASTSEGQAFVSQLADLTGTDVAASINITGSSRLGGDLSLEYATGPIEAATGRFSAAWNASGLTLATFTVSNTSDSGAGSLRQAILDANNEVINPGADTIVFAANLTTSAAATINLTTSPNGNTNRSAFVITSAITITGPTGSNGITLNNTFVNQRLFYVSAAGNLTLDSLTLSGGKAQQSSPNVNMIGGCILNDGILTITNSTISGNTASNDGGGIYNNGTLTVTNSTISNNTANRYGGGILNSNGILTVSNSTFSGNTANAWGGGIFNFATLTVTNSTLSGNTASGSGGGIYNSNGLLTITNSTISGNTAGIGGGGGIFNGATLNIANTIIANSNNSGDYVSDSDSTIGTNTNNLVDDGTLPGTSEIIGDPLLAALANNGGPTFTMALGATSPAISTTPLTPFNLDQRGFIRTNNDIGAFAFGGTAPVISAPAITSANAVTFPNGINGSFQFTATGYPAPTFSVTTGTLPAGLTLSTSGLLSGFTTTTGTATLTVTATNGVGTAATQSFSITVNPAPVFSSANSASFSTGVAGSFTAAATGAPTYSIAQNTFFDSNFATLPTDWTLTGSAAVNGVACVLNPATASTAGALILPKLGASSPGSFTASFDYTAANVTATGNTAIGTSFNYGVLSATTGSGTGMVGSNGLVVSFLEAYIKAGAVPITVPASVEVRWNGTVIASAPITFGNGGKPVVITLDGANFLNVSYDNTQILNMNLAGKVNAADRTNWQFAMGASNGSTNQSSHTVDNLSIVSNGVLPTGLVLDPTTGIISGTATTANNPGTQVFNLVANNANGVTRQAFTLNLASGGPVFTSADTQPMLPGVDTNFAIAAPGTAGATTYSVAPQPLVTTTLANAGTLPAGASINGSARFNADALELTQNVASQTGTVQFLGQGAQNPDAFSASFSYKVGGGTTVGGNGISFNYGSPGDNTKGLRVEFTELTSGANTLMTVAAYAGTIQMGSATIANPFRNNYNFVPVTMTMSAEGRVQVRVNNVLAFDAGNYSNWQTTDKSLWAFSFTGTTGASNNNFHTIKNLVIGTNGVLPPGLSLDTTTGVISGKVGIGTAVDEYVNITATNTAGSTMQLLKLDFTASNTLPGQRPGTGTSLGGASALGVTGEEFRNLSAFAALANDGSVSVWGNTANGGAQTSAPTGTGYTTITSNEKAFAALKNDGSIFAWGFTANGSTGEPTGTGYQMISATRTAFAAIKSDGSIVAWGNTANGGFFNATSTNSPTGTGYIRIFANGGGFAAQKIDGTIRTWGSTTSINNGSPAVSPTTVFGPRVTVNDYQSGASSLGAFGAISTSGTISTWGSSLTGGTTGKPTTAGQQEVVTTSRAMAAIDSNGFIKAWGDTAYGGTNAPSDSGYRQLYGNSAAFVAIRQDGSLSAWGSSLNGGSGAPTGTGYVQVFSTQNSFAALKADGSISVWGNTGEGNTTTAPAGTGYTNIFSSQGAFAASKADGSITVWGNSTMGGTNGPTGTGWTEINSSGTAFAARRSDGSLYSWGSSTTGGTGAPTGTNFLTVQSPTLAAPYLPLTAGATTSFVVNQTVQAQVFLGIQGDGLNFTITSGTLPVGMKLDAATGWIYGNPAEPGTFPLTINATSAAGSITQNFTLRVESSLLPNQRQGAGAVYAIGSGTESPNGAAFAGLTANGGVYAWGANNVGGSGAPTGTGYTQITAASRAYAALRYDGSITAWGFSDNGGTGAPTGSGYTKIYSTQFAFAALKADGSITAWGNSFAGGAGAPTGTGYTRIYATQFSFAAVKADGSITVWGDILNGAPTNSGYISIVPNANAYAALKADGSITAWGDSVGGGSNAPTGTGYTKIFANYLSYAALKFDGSIAVWGNTNNGGGANGPTGIGFVDVWSTANGFAAMKTDGSLVSWGATGTFDTSFPTETGFTQVFSTGGSFAALKANGSIVSWGATDSGGTGAPAGTDYTTIYTNNNAFAAMKADGSITVWGNSTMGGSNAPTGTGYTQIFSGSSAFAAMKADGTVSVWGNAAQIRGASGQVAFASIANSTAVVPARQFAVTGNLPGARVSTSLATQALSLNGVAGFQVGANTGLGLGSAITSGALPDGITLNVATGYLEGTATKAGTSNFIVSTYNGTGESSQAYALTVLNASTTTATPSFATTKPIGYAHYAVGQAATYDLTAVSTSPNTVNYSLIAGALPTGMTLQTTGNVIGTPTTPGNYQFTLAASDGKGIAAQTFTIKVSGSTPNQNIGQYSTIDSQSSGSQGLNESAFAALRSDGTITTWGDSTYGGAGATGVPTDAGYVLIAQTARAFAALRYDGSVQSWGNSDFGGTGAPTGTGFTRLFSGGSAFAAMKADGSIITWGTDIAGGTGEPTGTGFTQIFTNSSAMVAMKSDGSLTAWGNTGTGATGVPTGTGYVTITSNSSAFAALKSDGSIWAWGNTTNGGLQPALATNNSYTAIYSNSNGFAAVRADGSLATWGATYTGDKAFPGGSNFINVSATGSAFAALKSDGTIAVWGNTGKGGGNAPTGTGFTAIFSNQSAFAGLRLDGSIISWGSGKTGGTGTPIGTGYTQIYSNTLAFTALKNDGTVKSWGSANGKAPTTTGFIQVFSTISAFVGQKSDGSLVAWGATGAGSLGAPIGTGLTVSSAQAAIPYQQYGTTGELPTAYLGTRIGAEGGAGPAAYQVGALSQGAYYSVTGDLPAGLTLNPATGFLSGTPTTAGSKSFTITSTSAVGVTSQVYTLEVKAALDVLLPGQRVGSVPFQQGGVFGNFGAFATLKADGSITTWGLPATGGTGAPAGTGFTQIYSNVYAFAALKADGSISSWGDPALGGTGAPAGTGFTQIFYTADAFAALKADGSITAWGDAASGGTGAPVGTGFTEVFSTSSAFAALKADGSISTWGNAIRGGTGAPTGTGFTKVFATRNAFAALDANGFIITWGDATLGGTGAPTGNSYKQIFGNDGAFSALRSDGTISSWGNTNNGSTGTPTATGFTQIFATRTAFAATASNGAITAWGDTFGGGTGAPSTAVNGFTQIAASNTAFAALKDNGSIAAWGDSLSGGTGAPSTTVTGFIKVFSTISAFAALKTDGSIIAWGNTDNGGIAPTGSGFTQVFANSGAFVAMKADGSLTSWGSSTRGGTGATSAPSGTGYVTVQSRQVSDPAFAAFPASSALSAKSNQAFFANLGAQGVGARYEIPVGALPAGITLNATTGVVSGTPTVSGTFPFILSASTPKGTASQSFNMVVEGNIAPSFSSAAAATFTVGTAGNFTVNATGVPTAITYTITGSTSLPDGLTLNASTGVISGTPAAATGGVYNLTITATNTSGSTNQAFTLTVNQAPSITSPTSTTFETNSVGNFPFVASGYPLPTFTTNGPLPTGVTLSSAGVLSGTPAAGTGGVYSFTVVAANGIGNTSNQSFTLTVNSKPTFTSANSATFVSGQLGSFTVVATGFPTTVTYGLSLGSTLPAGLNFNSTTGVLSGTPTAAGGVYTVTLEATNGAGTTTQSFTINIGGAPAFTNPASAGFVAGTAGSFPFTASGFPAPSFSVTSGTLPQGVTLNSTTGVLSGTPALGSNGVFNFTVTATNGLNPDATQNFVLTVNEAPVFTSANATTFVSGTAGSFNVTATSYPTGATFALAPGSNLLPTGVAFALGVLSITTTPVVGGVYTFTIRATVPSDSTLFTDQTFTLTVNEAPSVASTAIASFTSTVSGGATTQPTVTGYPTALTWSTSSNLPSGLSLNSSTGVISGTPAAGTGGTYTVVLNVSNGVGSAATQTLTLTVNEAPAFTSANSTTFVSGTASNFNVTATSFPTLATFDLAPSSNLLPTGVAFASGVLSITTTPVIGGIYTFTIRATNPSISTLFTDQTFTLTVNEAPAITNLTSTSFQVGVLATPFQFTTSGFPAASFSTTSVLPSGVTLSSTGVLGGTPASGTSGSYTISVSADNGVGAAATQTFTLTVGEPATFTSVASTTFTVGNAGSFTLNASGFPVPTFTQTGTLPGGVNFNNGVLSGTPSAGAGGVYNLTFTATNGVGTAATQSFTLTVNAPALITTTTIANGTFAEGVTGQSFQLNASGNPSNFTWATSSILPAGLSLSSSGLLSGTPQAGSAGDYSLIFNVSNGVGTPDSKTISLQVGQVPVITSTTSANFDKGYTNSFQVVASGFPAPTFSTSSTLPNGVTLSSSGLLSGIPTQSGSFPITITASNNYGTPATQSFALTVAPTLGTSTVVTSSNNPQVAGNSITYTATITPDRSGGNPVGGTVQFKQGGVNIGSVVTVSSGVATLLVTAPLAGSYSITAEYSGDSNYSTSTSQVLTQVTTTLFATATSLTSSANPEIFGNSITLTATVTSGSGAPTGTVQFKDGATLIGSPITLVSGIATLSGVSLSAGSHSITAEYTDPASTPTFASSNSAPLTQLVNLAPSITSTSSATFQVGISGTPFSFTASGFPAPTFSVTSGTLPNGITLSSSGVLSGTPASGTAGEYTFTVTASNGVAPASAQSFTLTVNQPPIFTSDISTTFTKGTAGNFNVIASGFPAPTFLITSSALDGVTLNPTTGVLSFSSTSTLAGGTYNLTFEASNTIGSVQTATQSFSFIVLESASITSTTVSDFTAGSGATSFQFVASGTPASFNWSTVSALPAGLTLSTSGLLSGTPAAGTGGTYSINVSVSNGVGSPVSQSFTLTVNEVPVFTNANATTFTKGTLGSFQFVANGFPVASYSVTSGSLPTGLSLTSGGLLSGTPTAGTGSTPISLTIQASNTIGTVQTATQTFTLTVLEAASITSTTTAATFNAGSNTNSFTFQASGTPGTFNWTTSSVLPVGVTLNATSGELSGNPAAGTGGIYSINVNVSNGVGAVGTQAFTLTVNEAPTFTSANSNTFVSGTASSFNVTATSFPTGATFALSPTSNPLPTGVAFASGVLSITTTPVSGGVYTFTIRATNPSDINLFTDQPFTLTVNEAASVAAIATSTFTATVSGGATTQPTVTGYPTTFNWTTLSALPSGLSLNSSTGVISGTPAAGTGRIYTVVLNVSNGVGAAAVQTLTLTVNEAPTFTSANAATFISGTAGSFNFTATSFPTGATFALSSGTLPANVSLLNGVLSTTSTPVAGGVYNFTIRATNPSPSTLFTDQVFTLTVNEAAVITSSAATTFTVGTSGTSFQFTNTGYPAAATYSTASNLPQGLTLTSSGLLSGTPALGTGGVYTLVINATNGIGNAFSQTFTLTINEQPAITSFAATTFVVGTSGNFQLTASGQPTTITYTETGNLPNGVTLSSSGLLSGTPAAGTGGNYAFTITATNGVGTPSTQAFTLTVNEAASFTSATTTTFKTEVSRSFLFTAIGQPNVFTYALGSNSVNLPQGVTLSSSGVLSGIPAAGTGGLYAITVEVSNGIGAPASQTFNLVVEQPPAFTNASSTTFTGGNPSSFTLTSSGYPTNFNYTLISGTLPPGITLDPTTGLLSGTIPGNEQGVFDVVFGVGNAVTPDATQSFRFNVQPSGGLYMYDSVLKTLSISLANDVDLNFNETAGTFTFSMINPSGATPVFGPVTGSGILSGSGTSTITILAANLSGGVTLNNDNAVSQNTDNDLRFTAGTLNSALLKVELIGTGTVDFLQGTTTGITGGMSFTVNNTVTIEGNLTAGSGTFERDRSSYGVNLIGSTTSIDAVAFNNNKTVGLGDEVGDLLTFAGGLTTNAQIDTFAAGTIRTNSNLIQIDRLSLLANTVLDTRATGSGASILLNDPKQNGFTLITFTKVTDSVTLTGNVQLNDLMATVTGNLVMGNGVTPTTITVTTDGDVSALGGSVTFNSNTVIDTGAKNVTFVADTVDFNPAASFQGTGKIGFTPMTQGNNIYLGTAASTAQSGMKVNQDGIDTLSSKYQSVTFGSQGYNGIITVGETVVSNQINLINNGGGKIYVVGDLVVQGVSADGVGVFIIGSGSTTILNSDIITPGTAVLIQDAVQVDAPNVIIDTTNGGTLPLGANVTITGGTTGIFSTLGSSNNLTVTAGTQGDAFIGSLLGFGNAGGLGSFVNDLTITGNNIYITKANIINGALVLGDSGSNTQISLDGAVLNGLLPSTGYSKFTSASVTLAGTLDVVNTNPSFDPQVGTRFSIFESTATNKTSGGFLGMPQGTEFNVGLAKYAITYIGGTGYNDVQLVSINEVPTPTGPIITSPFSVDLNTIIATNSGVVTFTNMSGGLVRSFQPFAGYTGNITVSGVDQTGDGVPDALVVGKATLGDVSTVMVIDAATGRQTMLFDAFQPSFLGGVSLTSGLVNIGGQSQTVVVVGAGQGGGPHVKLYSTQNGQELSSFYAFSQTFAGGVNLAAADLNNDGYSEIVAGAGQGGGPEVRVFSGQNFSVIKAFMAYELNFSGGVYVAAGDLDSDNTQEIITGAAAGGGSRVIVWDYDTLAVENNFMAYGSIINSSGQVIDEFFSGGVRVGLGDVNGDGLIDLVTGAGPSGGPNVKVFGGLQLDLLLSYFAGNPEDEDGVFVA